MTLQQRKTTPSGFATPEQLPPDEEQAKHWQQANRLFWESSPMRYDWKEGIGADPFTTEFFEEIDRRFFGHVREFMPWKAQPFDNLIDFDSLANTRVLEIGVGMGSHAQLLAKGAASYTGIDLTEYAVMATSRRLRLLGIRGEVMQMDAERMAFPDSAFDLVWTWGVIHHSSNTQRIVAEMHRVLRPGGRAIVMVYHRGWWNYYVVGGFVRGLLRGGLLRHGSLHRTVQAVTDGALARFYSAANFRRMAEGAFRLDSIAVKGGKADVFPMPAGRFKRSLMDLVPDATTRFLANSCRMGSYLIVHMTKR